MADLTECPVCFEEYVEPKILPCSHTLCLKCLVNLQKPFGGGKYVRCPMCNTKHNVPRRGVQAFVENPHVIQLLKERMELRALKKYLEGKLDTFTVPINKKEENLCQAIANVSLEAKKYNKTEAMYTAEFMASIGQKGIGSKVINFEEKMQENDTSTNRNSSGARAKHTDNQYTGARAKHIDSDNQYAGARAKQTDRDNQYTGSRDKQTDTDNQYTGVRAKQTDRDNQYTGVRAKLTDSDNQYTGARAKQTASDDLDTAAVLLTVSRQKLAFLQCRYNPKCCTQCRRMSVESVELRRCSKCKVAYYCSRECQTMNWRDEHKLKCKEIRKLIETIQREEITVSAMSQGIKSLLPKAAVKAKQCGSYELDQRLGYNTCCFIDDKQMLGFISSNYDEEIAGIDVFNASVGVKEGELILGDYDLSNKMCTIWIDDKQYFILCEMGLTFQPKGYPRISTFSYKSNNLIQIGNSKCWDSEVSVYAFQFFENNLYVVLRFRHENNGKTVIQAYNINNNLELRPTSDFMDCPDFVISLCIMKYHGKIRFVILYNDNLFGENRPATIICIDPTTDRLLWEVKNEILEGKPFWPARICNDDKGHLFASTLDDQVVLINEDQSLQILLQTPGMITDIKWCEATQQLYVIYINSDLKYITERYDITEV